MYSYRSLRSQATRSQQPAPPRTRAELLAGDGVSPSPSPQLSLDDSALDATQPLSRSKKAATIDARNRRGHQQSAGATASPASGAGALGASDKSTVGEADEAEAPSPAAGANLRRSHSAARSRPSPSGRHGGGRMAGLASKLGLGGGRSSVRESRSQARSRERRNDEDAPAAPAGVSAATATGPSPSSSSGVSFTLERSACGALGVPLFLERIFNYIELHGMHLEAQFRFAGRRVAHAIRAAPRRARDSHDIRISSVGQLH